MREIKIKQHYDASMLAEWINSHGIKSEDIQQIITGGSYYTVFYWEDVLDAIGETDSKK